MLTVIALAVQCGVTVDPGILAAIVQVESRGNPYALSINGDAELTRQPRDRDEAMAMARWLQEHGYNFDAGIAQVNSSNFDKLGLSVADLFDSCANLRAAAHVLEGCYGRALQRLGERDEAVAAAVSCYNTGTFTRGVANGYVQAVRANAAGPLKVRARTGTEPVAETKAPIALKAKERRTRGGNTRTARGERGSPGVFAERMEDVFGKFMVDAFGGRKEAVASGEEGRP